MAKSSVGAAIAAFFKGKGYPDQASAELAGIVTPLATTDESSAAKASELREMVDAAMRDGFKRMRDEWEKEETEKKEKEAKDRKAAKDAEEEEERKKKEREEKEETGDTLIEAEEVGHVINLGKVWTAQSKDAALTEIRSRAEIMAPGLSMPTVDACRGSRGAVLSNFLRSAIKAVHTKDAQLVEPFLMGRKVEDLRGSALLGAFNGVCELVKIRNNAAARAVAGGLRTVDGGGGAGAKARMTSAAYAEHLAKTRKERATA